MRTSNTNPAMKIDRKDDRSKAETACLCVCLCVARRQAIRRQTRPMWMGRR